jgi:hypothetical protein
MGVSVGVVVVVPVFVSDFVAVFVSVWVGVLAVGCAPGSLGDDVHAVARRHVATTATTGTRPLTTRTRVETRLRSTKLSLASDVAG